VVGRGDDDAAGRDLQRARWSAFEEIQSVVAALPVEFPEAFGGTHGGPDEVTVLVVEGAPGAEALVATLRAAERRSLDAVGVTVHFSFAPARVPHTRLDEVRAELAGELFARRGIATRGLIGVGLGSLGLPGDAPTPCVAVHADLGMGVALMAELKERFPGIPLRVDETPRPRTMPLHRPGPL
jgi:hypothetical protein